MIKRVFMVAKIFFALLFDWIMFMHMHYPACSFTAALCASMITESSCSALLLLAIVAYAGIASMIGMHFLMWLAVLIVSYYSALVMKTYIVASLSRDFLIMCIVYYILWYVPICFSHELFVCQFKWLPYWLAIGGVYFSRLLL